MTTMKQRDTSWNKVAGWYGKKVGDSGHFYHEQTILPLLKKYFDESNIKKLLDLGCGQGVVERVFVGEAYVGIDLSSVLLSQAQRNKKNEKSRFIHADASKSLPLKDTDFDCAVSVLALQNIENYEGVINNCAKHIKKGGSLVLVLNHPYYRIPRASGWMVLQGNSKQVRWVSDYLKVKRIPITMNPGAKGRRQTVTWSFHVPLSHYIKSLSQNGFYVDGLEELVSSKESVGKFANRENIAREEIPLFMFLTAKKVN